MQFDSCAFLQRSMRINFIRTSAMDAMGSMTSAWSLPRPAKCLPIFLTGFGARLYMNLCYAMTVIAFTALADAQSVHAWCCVQLALKRTVYPRQ
jgi:hypothetical protein